MKFAEGSNSQTISATPSCVRAIDSYLAISRSADRLLDALDTETIPGHFHTLDDDDSLIVALKTASHDASGKKSQIGG